MPQRFLLDTVAAIAILEADNTVLEALPFDAEVEVPIIVLGELYAGAENSGRRDQNIKRVLEFASNQEIVLCDDTTAQTYGKIVAQLRKEGHPIPQTTCGSRR